MADLFVRFLDPAVDSGCKIAALFFPSRQPRMKMDRAPPPSPTAAADASSVAWPFLFVAWLIALIATLGALFIGEVMGQTPCHLCWHQRVFMFPLALILAVASFRADRSAWLYALPLAALGALIAGFHSLRYARIIPETITPCSSKGPSCSSSDMTILGGVPLPFLSLAAFTAIIILLLLACRRSAA